MQSGRFEFDPKPPECYTWRYLSGSAQVCGVFHLPIGFRQLSRRWAVVDDQLEIARQDAVVSRSRSWMSCEPQEIG